MINFSRFAKGGNFVYPSIMGLNLEKEIEEVMENKGGDGLYLSAEPSRNYTQRLAGSYGGAIERNKGPLFLLGVAVFLVGIGYAALGGAERTRIERIKTDKTDDGSIIFEAGEKREEGAGHNSAPGSIFVDVSGAVLRPGVYELGSGARVKDALVAAGGLAAGADREYVSKNVNLAAPIADGAKVYIPEIGERAQQAGPLQYNNNVAGAIIGKININTASAGELEKLKGIGEVRARAIIDNRPYSSIDELKTKSILGQKTYEKIKDEISVY